MLHDPSLYVTYDDKIKLAELLKQASRDKLTEVVKLIRSQNSSEHNVVDECGSDRFQLKLDQIQKPLFDQCYMILN